MQGTIEGRRDIASGRLAGDKRSLVNTASGQCFTSLTYSADGSQLLAGNQHPCQANPGCDWCRAHLLLSSMLWFHTRMLASACLAFPRAGGRSKFVCIYDTEERLMLRRFQVHCHDDTVVAAPFICVPSRLDCGSTLWHKSSYLRLTRLQVSKNRSLDGVLDQLNSRTMTDAGPADLIADAPSDDDTELLGPGGTRMGACICTSCLHWLLCWLCLYSAASSHGRCFMCFSKLAALCAQSLCVTCRRPDGSGRSAGHRRQQAGSAAHPQRGAVAHGPLLGCCHHRLRFASSTRHCGSMPRPTHLRFHLHLHVCCSLTPDGIRMPSSTTQDYRWNNLNPRRPAEGVLLYSLDEGLVFDPTDLGVEVTPAAVHSAAARGAWLQAFLLALRLNQPPLLRHVILSTPPKQVGAGPCEV